MSENPIYKDIARLKKLIKQGWWIGMLLGLLCHFLPPDYQAACHAIVKACSP